MVFLNNFVHADLHPGNLLVHQVKCCTIFFFRVYDYNLRSRDKKLLSFDGSNRMQTWFLLVEFILHFLHIILVLPVTPLPPSMYYHVMEGPSRKMPAWDFRCRHGGKNLKGNERRKRKKDIILWIIQLSSVYSNFVTPPSPALPSSIFSHWSLRTCVCALSHNYLSLSLTHTPFQCTRALFHV